MKIAVTQPYLQFEKQQDNYLNIKNLIQDVDADIICLPELFSTGVTKQTNIFAEDQSGPTTTFLKSIANDCAILGSYISTDEPKPKNRAIVVSKSKEVIHKYDKIQLFSHNKEDEDYQKGDQLQTFTFQGFKCATLICYDLRFSELFNALYQKGIDVIFIGANWPTKRIEQWEILLRARAIEYQTYIVASNVVSDYYNLSFGGGSMIIGPDGVVLQKANSNSQEIIQQTLSLDDLNKVRNSFVIAHDKKCLQNLTF